MLLVTYMGVTVNMDHVACIHLKAEDTDPDATQSRSREDALMRVLLMLAGENCVVAARDLPPAVARYVREAVTRAWAGGATITDMRKLLKQYAETTHTAAQRTDGGEEAQSAP